MPIRYAYMEMQFDAAGFQQEVNRRRALSGLHAAECDVLCGVAGVHSACSRGTLTNSRMSTYLAVANLWDINIVNYLVLSDDKTQ